MPLSPSDMVAILDAHNKYRAAVGVPPLEWSATLAAGAEAWAIYLATSVHHLEHSNIGLGENLAWSSGGLAPGQFVDLWGAEQANFVSPCPSFQGLLTGCPCSKTGSWLNIGHYTQIVWRNTKQVGCGLAQDTTSGAFYFVARYDPPGNVIGQPPY